MKRFKLGVVKVIRFQTEASVWMKDCKMGQKLKKYENRVVTMIWVYYMIRHLMLQVSKNMIGIFRLFENKYICTNTITLKRQYSVLIEPH